MACWWIANRKARERVPRHLMPVDMTSGRNAPKQHVRGKIVARAHVGFEEEDWRFLVAVSKGSGVTISDIIRDAVSSSRKECEKDLEPPVWMSEDWDKQ